jgi:hypothetical protein
MGLKERIQEAFTHKDGTPWKPAEIARATDRSKAAVSLWLSGDIKALKGETAALMEAATGYRATWLITGKGPKLASDQETPNGRAIKASSFDALTGPEKELLTNFRQLLDEDQEELRTEIERRAVKARAYIQQALKRVKESQAN